jgi:hypothetical protein
MKSFTARSFDTAQAAVPPTVLARLDADPQALFTDFQWYLYKGRDTVFYTAFAERQLSKADVIAMVENMVRLAPQLTYGFPGSRPGEPLTDSQLDAITSIEDVDSFEGYPDKWLSISHDLFDQPGIPMFRVMVANRRGGPDAEGRTAIIQVRAAHCLLEGSDSALLTRSQPAGHGVLSDKANKASFGSRLGGMFTALTSSAVHLFFAYVLSPKDKPLHAATLAIPRRRLRAVANALGVRQRSLYFALVSAGLNGDGPVKNLSNKAISAAYTMVGGKRTDSDDDFFRVRALQAKFPVSDDFVTFVRSVDETVGKIEERDVTKMQMYILAMFGMHRRIHRIAPWIYGPRFWRFSGAMHMVLTLVPPHRLYGPMTQGMVEPIYCGAYHPAVNICTFCPGREYVTFNFTMEERHIASVERILPLLDRIEAALPISTDRSAPQAELA